MVSAVLQAAVVSVVETLCSTPELVEACQGSVAASLLPALISLVAASGGDKDIRYRGLELLSDILVLFIGDSSGDPHRRPPQSDFVSHALIVAVKGRCQPYIQVLTNKSTLFIGNVQYHATATFKGVGFRQCPK